MEIIHESNFAPGFRWPDSPCCSGTSRTLRLRRLPERPGPIRLLRQLVAGAESRTRGNVEAVYDEAEGGDRAPPQASGELASPLFLLDAARLDEARPLLFILVDEI